MRADPSAAPPRLMSASEKLVAFDRAGLEHVYIPHFGASFAAQSPDEFAASLARMNVRWVMVGDDFRYGSRRVGDIATLRAEGARLGIDVETMPDIANANGRISSTAVREALAKGELPIAAQMLGRSYSLFGRVLHGKKLGRTLGFPTANIALTHRKPALQGVFAVKCRSVTRGLEGVASKGGPMLNGVANLGTNPVVSSENRHHLEVFLFDFSGDLYGQRLEVIFIEKIRDEMKFPGLEALVMQMHQDAADAKTILRISDDGTEN
jgi:riboflavin kinase/FMN adenylyltransferase